MSIIKFHWLAEFTSAIIKALKERQIIAYQELNGGVAFVVISVGSADRARELGWGLDSSSLSHQLCNQLITHGAGP